MTNDLLSIAHRLSEFVVGAEGNVSMRTPQGFIIKASGYGFVNLNEHELVECDLAGISIAGNNINKPSMEATFHAWLYKNTDCDYIAHTHPKNTLKILCTKSLATIFANMRLFPDQVIYNGLRSCVVPYASPGKLLAEQINQSVTEFTKENNFFPKLLLLQNHGIICIGKSANECIFASQICEKAATIFLGSYQTNDINYLTTEQIDYLSKDENENHRLRLCQE